MLWLVRRLALGWLLCGVIIAGLLLLAHFSMPEYGIVYESRPSLAQPQQYYLHDTVTGVRGRLPENTFIQSQQSRAANCAPEDCHVVLLDSLGRVRNFSEMDVTNRLLAQFVLPDGRLGLAVHEWLTEQLDVYAVDTVTGTVERRYQIAVQFLNDFAVQGDYLLLVDGAALRVHDSYTGAAITTTVFDEVPMNPQVSPGGQWVAARENRANGTHWLHWVALTDDIDSGRYRGAAQSHQLAGVSQYAWSAGDDLIYWHVNDPSLYVCAIRMFRLNPQTQTRAALPVRLECRNMTDEFLRIAINLQADDPDSAVSLSPDRRYLLVRRGVDATYQLLDLMTDAPPVTLPVAFHQWTPDSRYLVGATQLKPAVQLIRYDVQTGRVEPYARLPQSRRIHTRRYTALHQLIIR